jgi:hypothetical protein
MRSSLIDQDAVDANPDIERPVLLQNQSRHAGAEFLSTVVDHLQTAPLCIDQRYFVFLHTGEREQTAPLNAISGRSRHDADPVRPHFNLKFIC